MALRRAFVVTESDRRLWLLLGSTWVMISRLHGLELAQLGLTPEQANILKIIKDSGNAATFKILENVTMRQQNSISIIINRMINSGLLTRTKKKRQKIFQISLTPEGKNLLKKIKLKTINTVFSCLTDQGKKQLADCLYPLYQHMHSKLVLADMTPFLQDITGRNIPDTRTPKDELTNLELWVLLDRTSFGIFRLLELEVTNTGLTMMQTMVLETLHNHKGPVTYKVLEDITMRQRHSVSSLVKRMIKAGLVTRDKNIREIPHTVSSTEKGMKMFDQVQLYSLKSTISSLTDKQKYQLVALLGNLQEKASSLLNT